MTWKWNVKVEKVNDSYSLATISLKTKENYYEWHVTIHHPEPISQANITEFGKALLDITKQIASIDTSYLL